MAGHAGWLAHTGWAVCLCCVVFCLPPRLWVTIHTLPQVHLQGRLHKGSLAVVHHWFTTDVQIVHISFIQMATVTLASFLTLFPPLTSLFFFLWQDHRCIHLCILCVISTCAPAVKIKLKIEPGQIPYSVTTCRKQSDRKLPWKIARSEWLNSKWGPWPGHTYTPVSECASTWMGKWPTEWMALSLMVTR